VTEDELPWDATPFLPLEGTDLAPYVVATVHPGSILRAPDPESREAEGRLFVDDVKVVKDLLDSL
jgi:uracil-DNA glycosylase